MTPQEKELITTLLERLKNAGGQPKDPEADALIRQVMKGQQPMRQDGVRRMGAGSDGGGFVRSAAASAAGVAGGALLVLRISSFFGNHDAGGLMGAGMTPGLGESVTNNCYGSGARRDFS